MEGRRDAHHVTNDWMGWKQLPKSVCASYAASLGAWSRQAIEGQQEGWPRPGTHFRGRRASAKRTDQPGAKTRAGAAKWKCHQTGQCFESFGQDVATISTACSPSTWWDMTRPLEAGNPAAGYLQCPRCCALQKIVCLIPAGRNNGGHV